MTLSQTLVTVLTLSPETLRQGGGWRPVLALTTFWFPGPELHHSPLLPPSPAEFLSSFHWGHGSEHVSPGGTESGIKTPYPNEGAQRQLPTSPGGLLGRRGFRKGELQMSVTLVVKRGTATRRVRRQPRGSQAS